MNIFYYQYSNGHIRPGTIRRQYKQLYYDQNPLSKRVLKYNHPRMHEIPMPGHARREERVEAQRKRNREQMNFFCRYVLAKQGKTIPYH